MTTRFRALLAPRMLGLHVLAVVLTAGTVLLGLWQYGVWQHDREDSASTLAHAAPRPLDSVLTSDAPFPAGAVGRPVSLSGAWLPGSSFFVADRVLHGQRGFWAVTPVAVCRGGGCAHAPAILVVRGWASRPGQAPPAPHGPVRVTGWLQPGETQGVPDPRPGDAVLPELSIADALQRVDRDLYGGYVIADRVSPGPAAGHGATAGQPPATGLTPVTPGSLPKPSGFTGLRNLLYALEWWVFGAFAVFLWVRWCRDEVARVTGVPSSA